ncbi:MAG: hypothetical protein ACLFN4_00845 [Candidatus Acetothermia bacterium]
MYKRKKDGSLCPSEAVLLERSDSSSLLVESIPLEPGDSSCSGK